MKIILFILAFASLMAPVLLENVFFNMDHTRTKYNGNPKIVTCPTPVGKDVTLQGNDRRVIFIFLSSDMKITIYSDKTPNLRIIEILKNEFQTIKSKLIIQVSNSNSFCKVRHQDFKKETLNSGTFNVSVKLTNTDGAFQSNGC